MLKKGTNWTNALRVSIIAALMAGLGLVAGCRREEGTGLKLVIISPHNDNIKAEFSQAFSEYYQRRHGEPAALEFRDVGGGTSTILQYLRNVYGQSDRSGIDIVWGGGEQTFIQLAAEGLLRPVTLPAETLEAIPAAFGGLPMYDKDNLWYGTAVSGFGFLYNRVLLERLNLPAPRVWDDLASESFYGMLSLADPMQSGSVAVVYEMVVQSGEDWPSGWAKLLAILGNSKRFFDSAGAAAEAPGLGEAPVATCIDFYGMTRVSELPNELVYVSPPGQTAFTPDPIAVLKNPPNAALAEEFVNFVLTPEGQALWALRVGTPHGPQRYALGRTPIRRDVFELYADEMLDYIDNPYASGQELSVDIEMLQDRHQVLKRLVGAAAIDNGDALRRARRRVIEANDPALTAEFNALPDNVRTRAQIAALAAELHDHVKAEQVYSEWIRFFRGKYQRIAQ